MSTLLRMTAAAVPLLVGLAALGAEASGGASAASGADPTARGPLRCEIQKSQSGGQVSLAGIVHADVAMSGSYAFHVVSGGSGGSANVQQGGAFTADPKAPVTLGTVSVGAGASYTATLSVTANGTTVTCKDPATSAG